MVLTGDGEVSLMSTDSLISPSRLALFSRSPVIGAWWEELHSIDPDRAPRPQVQALDELLFDAGLKHEKVLIGKLKVAKRTIAELPGKQSTPIMDKDTWVRRQHLSRDFLSGDK